MNQSDPIQKKTTVKQIMTNSIVSADSTVTASVAAKMMEDVGIGAIVVLENSMYAHWNYN